MTNNIIQSQDVSSEPFTPDFPSFTSSCPPTYLIPSFDEIMPHCHIRFKAIPPIFRLCNNGIQIGADAELSLQFFLSEKSKPKQACSIMERWLHQDSSLTAEDIALGFDDAHQWSHITSTIMQHMHPLRKLRDWVDIRPKNNLNVLIYGRGPITDYLDDYCTSSPLSHTTIRHKSSRLNQIHKYDFVIISDSILCDEYLYIQLLKHRIPHIYVGLLGNTIQYGPTVLPGHTPCYKCFLLQKNYYNQGHLNFLAHTKYTSHYYSPPVISLAGAKVGQEVQYINTFKDYNEPVDPPESLGTVINIRLDSLTVKKTVVTRQSLCPCSTIETHVS